jgi:hypothetical protein
MTPMPITSHKVRCRRAEKVANAGVDAATYHVGQGYQ